MKLVSSAILLIFLALPGAAQSLESGPVEAGLAEARVTETEARDVPASTVHELDIPLGIDLRHLEPPLARALGMDEAGMVSMDQDACNRLTLSDMQLFAGDRGMGLDMALGVTTGTDLFGGCRGPGTWQGRIQIQLEPRVAEGGRSIELIPRTAELRRPDGSAGLLARPGRLMAENLVLPRLDGTRLDLEQPLAALDGLAEEFLHGHRGAAGVTGPVRLASVELIEEGVEARLVLAIHRSSPVLQPSPPVEPSLAESSLAEPPLADSELAVWARVEDELDGFLTVIIARFAAQTDDPALRVGLLSVLLDARHGIAEALVRDHEGEDPVRDLFVRSWNQLRPHLETLDRSDGSPDEAALRLAAFVAGGDLIRAADALGPEFGVEISRDGLRRLARMLMEDEAPERFVPLPLGVDPAFRALFGFDSSLETALVRAPESATRPWWHWLISSAHAGTAEDSPAEALRGLVPRLAILDDYLTLVSSLLDQTAGSWLDNGTRVPDDFRERMDPLIRATAWKESCWRHYVGSTAEPRVIRSPVGAVGMMQINGRVWRGVYDVDRLETDVNYNVTAGIEILEHYLVDYAIRRGEHEQPGGVDNLVRAAYAAYNGGPSHLARYRNDETPARLQAIDNEFWKHYQQMKSEGWPDVSSCYPVG